MNFPDNYEIIKDTNHILQKGDIYSTFDNNSWTAIIGSIGYRISNYQGYRFARPIKNKIENIEYIEANKNDLCDENTYYREQNKAPYHFLSVMRNTRLSLMMKSYPDLLFYKKVEKPRFPNEIRPFPFGY